MNVQAPAPIAAEEVSLAPDTADRARLRTRKRLLLGLSGVVAIAVLGGWGWYALFGVKIEATDNAYAGVDSAQITPLVSGAVAAVLVTDTQTVHAGDVLVRIDAADARLALAEAEAALAQTERRVRGLGDDAIAAAEMVNARRIDVETAGSELERRRRLGKIGAISREDLANSESRYLNSRATLAQAEAQRRSAHALVSGVRVSEHPDVLAARARRDAAQLALERTLVHAPLDGVVAQRSVQVGQMVAAGEHLMIVAPLNRAYVDANFKEGQLRRMRIGQPVEVTADLYGGDVVFHGRVAGIGGGTGQAFALIPAQNATGNWIKVVQRVPVRIALDPSELEAHPLRAGLSMHARVRVDTPEALAIPAK